MHFGSDVRTVLRFVLGPGLLPACAVAALFVVLSHLASPARAGTAAGVAAYDQGDLPTAFREFSTSARAGDAEASYRLAIMYIYGEGTPSSDLLAYKWLTCVAEGPAGGWLGLKAKMRRSLLGLFDAQTAQNGHQLAQQDCALVAAETKSPVVQRVESKTKRDNWFVNFLLYPGDAIVLTLVGLGEFFAFGWLVKLIDGLVDFLGNIFPAILAAIIWGILWRICFAAFDRSTGGSAAQQLASQGRVRSMFRRRRNDRTRLSGISSPKTKSPLSSGPGDSADSRTRNSLECPGR